MKTAEEVFDDLANERGDFYLKFSRKQITQALIAYATEQGKTEREKGFHEGKEFAILTIGNAITSGEGSKSPFLAYSVAAKALR